MRKICLIIPLLLSAVPAAAQDGQDVSYSWLILVGLLVSIILLGLIVQLRKPGPRESREQVQEDTKEEL